MKVMWTCPVCRLRGVVRTETPRVFCHGCGYVQENGPVPGLGDYIAAVLRRVGITQTRYLTVKRWLGFVPKCGCRRRQKKLNALGRWIGIGKSRDQLRRNDDADAQQKQQYDQDGNSDGVQAANGFVC